MAVLSIVGPGLRTTGPVKVTKRFSEAAKEEIAKCKYTIKKLEETIKNVETNPSEPSNAMLPLWKQDLILSKDKLKHLQTNANKIITTTTEYVDSNGAKYVETITKDGSNFGTGTPVRKLVKTETRYLPDGRKITTRTTHNRSDECLMGEGRQDGFIEKVEELVLPDGKGPVARRTTSQQASGHGGKTVTKEVSKDGQPLAEHNTVANARHFDSQGKCTAKSSYDGKPGIAYEQQFKVDENGIAHVIEDKPKINW